MGCRLRLSLGPSPAPRSGTRRSSGIPLSNPSEALQLPLPARSTALQLLVAELVRVPRPALQPLGSFAASATCSKPSSPAPRSGTRKSSGIPALQPLGSFAASATCSKPSSPAPRSGTRKSSEIPLSNPSEALHLPRRARSPALQLLVAELIRVPRSPLSRPLGSFAASATCSKSRSPAPRSGTPKSSETRSPGPSEALQLPRRARSPAPKKRTIPMRVIA